MQTSFSKKKNIGKKLKRRRKIKADKWIFWGRKWSAFENSCKNPKGVTNYACKKGDWSRNVKGLRETFKISIWLNQGKIFLT